MCGVSGVFLADASTSAVPELLEASLLLQHRGQDACGVASYDSNGRPIARRGFGLVTEVFGAAATDLLEVTGYSGIAHVRYRTAGQSRLEDIQPLCGSTRPEMSLCHNGHLVNHEQLAATLLEGSSPPPTGSSDSTLILHVLANNLHSETPSILALSRGLEAVYRQCSGAFACLAMLSPDVMVGFRDRHGLKPLSYAQRMSSGGSMDYMFASESVVLEKLGFSNILDVMPGEAVICTRTTFGMPRLHRRQILPMLAYTPDILEYVYLARPDSVLDGICVQSARQCVGKAMAQTVTWLAVADDVDVVIPVPETSYTSALATAQALNKPFAFGLVKNRYIGRTFIMPQQEQRKKSVVRKLNAVKSEFRDRHVLLIDDSIVRGTTSRAIVQMAYDAGARKVTFASCSPAIRYNHKHGIDLADNTELIAHAKTVDQVKQALGCDHLVYLPLSQLLKCCMDCQSNKEGGVQGFEVGVFSGNYVTDTPPKDTNNSDSRCNWESKDKKLDFVPSMDVPITVSHHVDGSVAAASPSVKALS